MHNHYWTGNPSRKGKLELISFTTRPSRGPKKKPRIFVQTHAQWTYKHTHRESKTAHPSFCTVAPTTHTHKHSRTHPTRGRLVSFTRILLTVHVTLALVFPFILTRVWARTHTQRKIRGLSTAVHHIYTYTHTNTPTRTLHNALCWQDRW